MKAASDQTYGEQFKARIAKSDRRIKAATAYLRSTSRGQQTLKELKTFLLGGSAAGLDSEGQKALLALVEEFTKGQRREFIDAL